MFFREAKLLDGILSNNKEKVLFQGLYHYITETFSFDPKQADIIDCCKAVLQLFPYLETKPSDFFGIVSSNN